DYKPPAVLPGQLTRFLEAFNYSVIAFSSQWRFTEPQEGKPDYTDLDQYVQWCAEHGIRGEFHLMAGYQPSWLRSKFAVEQAKLLATRAKTLIEKYGSRISDWQITNESI